MGPKTPLSGHGSGPQHDLAILIALLLLRSINSLAVKTFFQPDEYFQSLEPAWQAAFGSQSGAWITWEWREGLRSSLHPLLFAGVYRAADQFSDLLTLSVTARSGVLLAAPKILQAGFAATMDYFTYTLAGKIYGCGSKAAHAALLLTVVSPWQAFCSVRTLSNSLETALTISALYLWPWDWFLPAEQARAKKPATASPAAETSSTGLYASLATAALACILRPTNIILWATISITLLLLNGSLPKLACLAQAALLSGGAILAASISADRMFYDAWILPPLRFLQFNLVQSLAVFYGVNRPDYYLTEGLPLLLTTALPFAALGLWQSFHARSRNVPMGTAHEHEIRFTLATAVVSTVGILSLISHKEVRFIYPLLPMLHILAARPLANFFGPFPSPDRNFKRALLLLLICANALIGWYAVFIHQRGVVDVMQFLRHSHEASITARSHARHLGVEAGRTTIGFLMPCHSTPWRSHLVHSGIDAWALTCEPPLNLTLEERKTYMDEADVFYDDPIHWLANNMGDRESGLRPWPKHLVFFEQLERQLISWIPSGAYRECWRGFNTHFHDDWRRQGDVVVWCMTDGPDDLDHLP